MTNKAIIKLVVVQNEKWEHIPVQVCVTRYEEGKPPQTFDSMIRPPEGSHFKNLPRHLNMDILKNAPSVYTVAKLVEEMVQGCKIESDNAFKLLMKNKSTMTA